MSTRAQAAVHRGTGHEAFTRFAWFVLAYNVLVVLWGAFVRATGSGGGCGGHWPLCNGEMLPRDPSTATLIEYTHRLTSGLSLALMAVLWIWSRREFDRGSRVRRAATLAAVFLVIEALLGAGLIWFDYVAHNASIGRGLYLALHLANTEILIAMVVLTAWLSVRPDVDTGLRQVPISVLTAMVFTILLSMTGAIAALGDTLFPAASVSAGVAQELAGTANFLLRLRAFHPLFAIVSGFYLLYVASTVARMRPAPGVKRAATAIAALVLLQICAGAINVALLAPVWMQLAHLLVANLLWISLVLLSAEASVTGRRDAAQASATGPATFHRTRGMNCARSSFPLI